MTPLPPVRKRTDYSDIKTSDLAFALFSDRILQTDAMSPQSEGEQKALDLSAVPGALSLIADTLAADADAAIKAGARNSAADRALIQQIFECANDLEELAIALGADPGDDDDSEMDEEEEEGGELEMGGGVFAAKKSADAPDAQGIEFINDDLAIFLGDSVKTLVADNGVTEGYLVKFGGEGDLTNYRDIFLKSPDTDYGNATKTDVYVHHRLLPGLGKKRLNNQAEIKQDDVGIFIKHLLDLRDPYERALYGLAQKGKLGWSSGTAPHLVDRERTAQGSHVIKHWPLGLDASYTPTPAGGFGVEARAGAMKSLFDEAGLDLLQAMYEESEIKSAPADSERVRRLMIEIEIELLELEQVGL